jgi:hypothetical protein
VFYFSANPVIIRQLFLHVFLNTARHNLMTHPKNTIMPHIDVISKFVWILNTLFSNRQWQTASDVSTGVQLFVDARLASAFGLAMASFFRAEIN